MANRQWSGKAPECNRKLLFRSCVHAVHPINYILESAVERLPSDTFCLQFVLAPV